MNDLVQLKKSIVRELDYSYEACSISENQIIEILGYNTDNVPEPVLDAVSLIIKNLPGKTRYKSGYKIFKPGKVRFDDHRFIIDNKNFNCGKIIYSQLKNSDTIAFIIASVGEELDKWSKSFMDNNEILKAYLIDKVASELVEKLADKTQLVLENELDEIELKITNRYSPGYCGWSVADQQNLFSLLPLNFCNVSVNENSMMFPIKSISAVIGVGKSAEKIDYNCSVCDLEFCYKRDRNA